MIDKRDLFIKSTIYEGDSEEDVTSSESGSTSGEITPLTPSTPRSEIPLPSTPKNSPRILYPPSRLPTPINEILNKLAKLRSEDDGPRYPSHLPRSLNQLRTVNSANNCPKLNTIEEEIVTYTMKSGGNTITLRTNNPWIKRSMKITEVKDEVKKTGILPPKLLKSKFLLTNVLKPEPVVDIGFEKRAERAIFMQDLLLSSLRYDDESSDSD